MKIGALSLLVLLLGATPGPLQTTDGQSRITIAQDGDHYVLTMPVSRVAMRVPKGRWVQSRPPNVGGGTTNPGYFYFENTGPTEMAILSGWFEPAAAFKGVEAFWADELASLKRAGAPTPQKISFEDLGSWKLVLYSVEQSGIVSAHIRAHLVQSGTWIDLHLSRTSFEDAPSSWRMLRDVLKGIQVADAKLDTERPRR